MSKYDVVIRGGKVVDGTGAPERSADVAIKDGVIADVGTVDAKGADACGGGQADRANSLVEMVRRSVWLHA